jgi:hypothetical protein
MIPRIRLLIDILAVGTAILVFAPTAYPQSGAGAARLCNLSARADVGTGENVLIAGFAIKGDSTSTPKNLLVRGMGPSLNLFNLSGVLENPILTFTPLAGANPAAWAVDTGWTQPIFDVLSVLMLPAGGDFSSFFQPATLEIMASVGAFLPEQVVLTPPSSGEPSLTEASADSALVATVPAGIYTAGVSGVNNGTGLALAEVYDADAAMGNGANTARLVNFSARGNVGTGTDILIAGFVISGTGAETLLVRGMGPSLAPLGISGALAAPVITLHDANGLVIASNAGWANPPSAGNSPVGTGLQPATAAIFSSVGAFQPISANSADSALVITLPAGAYTVSVTGAGDGTGVALAELYEIPQP